MPRRALRCAVDLNIHAVTAPGVWLPNREDVYLSISFCGQYRNTRLIPSVFPLCFHEKFVFEKTYYTAVDPSEVVAFLEDELIIFELIQLSDYRAGATRLATFTTDAREFLYPYPSLAPSYASADREILMSRTIAFPGISPKIEFSTKTTIRESIGAEADALEDALDEARQYRRSRSRSRSRSRTRRPLSARSTRSPSPAFRKQMADITLYDSPTAPGVRPPFVVRKLEDSLIGRKPGTQGPLKGKKGKKKKGAKRPSSPLLGRRWSLGDTYSEFARSRSPGIYRPKYHLRQVIRDAGEDPLPVFETHFMPSDDEDAEVAALTSVSDYYPLPRPRSTSPILYKTSFRDRFNDSVSDIVSDRIDRALRRNRSLERLNLYSPPLSRRSPTILDPTMADLAADTSLAKHRSLVHLGGGSYWSERAAALSGKSHRNVFTDNLSKIYTNMYDDAKK